MFLSGGIHSQLDRLTVRSVPVRFGPGFLTRVHGGAIGQAFRDYQALKRRQQMSIIVRAIIWFAPLGGSPKLIAKCVGPFFPCVVPLLGELDCESECLRLPEGSANTG